VRYQVCAFCFSHLQKDTNRCASCQRPFDADAIKRVGVQFRPTRSDYTPPTRLFAARRVVYITGLPEALLSSDTLCQNRHLGQYGRIVKIAVRPPDGALPSKVPPAGALNSVLVKFSMKEAATACVLALDGFVMGDTTIRAAVSVAEMCTSVARGRACRRAGTHTHSLSLSLSLSIVQRKRKKIQLGYN